MILLLKVEDVVSKLFRAPIHVVAFTVGFCKVAGDQSFSGIGVNVDEVRGHQIAVHDCDCQGKHTDVAGFGSKDDHRQESGESDHKDLSSDPVEADAGIVAAEEVRLLTDGLALSCSITVGDSAKMNVGVGIGPREIEDADTAATHLVAAFTGPTTLSPGITLCLARLTLKKSKIMQRMLRNAFRKDPPTTLPKFLQR